MAPRSSELVHSKIVGEFGIVGVRMCLYLIQGLNRSPHYAGVPFRNWLHLNFKAVPRGVSWLNLNGAKLTKKVGGHGVQVMFQALDWSCTV